MNRAGGKALPTDDRGLFDFRSALANSTLRGFGLAITNVTLATCFFLFAFANMKSFLLNPRLSTLLIVVTESIVAVFLVIRRDPDKTDHSWRSWSTTTLGTLAPFFLRPAEVSADVLPGTSLQIAGFVLQIAALLALNRSLGLLPAYRGIKSRGLYGWVRHPLYMAYVVMYLGYFLNNPSPGNLLVVIAGTGFHVLRIRYEEALLMQYPDYRAYARKTRSRLLPALW